MTGIAGSIKFGVIACVASVLFAGVVVWWISPSGGGVRTDPRADAAGAAARRQEGVAPGAMDPRESHTINPSAFSETGPAEGAASRGGFEIEVIEAGVGPAANARLALIRDEKLLAVGTTNAAGVATFQPGDGEAQLSIVSAGTGIRRTAVSIKPGRRRVELPPGATITGRLELKGPPPVEPIEIQAVMYDGSPSDVEGKAFGELIRPRFKESPGGNLELRGLEFGSRWTFHCWNPVGFRLDDVISDSGDWRFSAPASGLVFKMTHLPVVRGRVVAGGTKAPIEDAPCVVTVASAEQPARTITGYLVADGVESAWSKQGGRFAVPVPTFRDAASIVHAELTIVGRSALSRRVIRLDPAPTEDLDLGDVELPATRTIEYLVSDAAGAPIEGAYARISGWVDPTTKTDAEGRGRITVGPEYWKVIVGALRYQLVELPIPEGTGPLRVVLEPTAGLEVRLVSTRGPLHESVRLRLKSAVEDLLPKLHDRTYRGQDEIVVVAGGSNGGGSCGPEGSDFTFSPLADGRHVIAGLRSGVSIEVEAVDKIDRRIAGKTITLAAGEWKTVEVEVTPLTVRTLRGVVRDVTGAPIEGAYVSISPADDAGMISTWDFTHTDAEGKFVLEGTFDPVVTLAVTASGYVRIVRRNMPLPAEGAELELVMRGGCRITVHVVREGGAPVPKLRPRVEVEGYLPFCSSGGEDGNRSGTYEFEDLPPDVDAKLTFELEGRKWTRDLHVKPGLIETITIPEKP